MVVVLCTPGLWSLLQMKVIEVRFRRQVRVLSSTFFNTIQYTFMDQLSWRMSETRAAKCRLNQSGLIILADNAIIFEETTEVLAQALAWLSEEAEAQHPGIR